MVSPISEENAAGGRRYARRPRSRRAATTTQWWLIHKAGGAAGPAQREAFAKLYQIYYPHVLAALKRAGASPETAGDVAQDFFLKLMCSTDLARLDSSMGSFRAWLRAAGRNLLRNHRRVPLWRGGGVTHVPFDDAKGETQNLAARSANPEYLIDRCKRELIVRRAYERLQRRFRSPLHALVMGELYRSLSGDERVMIDAELAALYSKTELAVRQQRLRIRKKFEYYLSEEEALCYPGSGLIGPDLSRL
jgi:RNA polymerase sigma factor (sigma-70 family)